MDILEEVRERGRLFPGGELNRIATGLATIRGRSLGPQEGAFIIIENDRGYIQLLANDEGHEFLAEIQSPAYRPEMVVTNEMVGIITACGFRLPEGRENFSRWFMVSDEADLRAIAELMLGLMNMVFGHQPGNALQLTVHEP